MTVKLLTENHLEFLSFGGGCTGSFEIFMSKCHIVESHVVAHIYNVKIHFPQNSKLMYCKTLFGGHFYLALYEAIQFRHNQ